MLHFDRRKALLDSARSPAAAGWAWAVTRAVGLVVLLGVAPLLAQAETGSARLTELTSRLVVIFSALENNAGAQASAWPTREHDQLNEAMAPPAVQRLQVEERVWLDEKASLLNSMETELERDPDAGFRILATSTDLNLLGAVVPRLARVAEGSATLELALLKLAARLSPCPGFLVQALSEVGTAKTSTFLLELGKSSLSLPALCAAVRSGDKSALGRLVDWADGPSGELAALALKALERLELPVKPSRARVETMVAARSKELQLTDPVALALLRTTLTEAASSQCLELALSRLRTVRSVDVKASLCIYVGHFRDPRTLAVLVSTYRAENSERVRLALLAAIGNIGPVSGDFLLGELTSAQSLLVIQKAAIHALGSARYRPAVRELIDRLDEPEIALSAARALRRITGEDFSRNQGLWTRWWKTKGQGQTEARDPDEV